MSVPESHPRPPALRLSDLILIFLLIAAGTLFLPLLLHLLGLKGSRDALANLALAYSLQYLWMFAVTLAVARGLRGLSWSELGFRPPAPDWLPGTLAYTLMALALAPLMNWIVYLLYGLITGEDFVNPQVQALAPRGDRLLSYIVMLLAAGILAPLVEETLFRGLLFSWVRRRSRFLAAALISAFLFSIAHFILVLVPALFVVGLILARVYERYNSLLPVVLLHGLFNASMLTLLYLAIASGEMQAHP